MRVFLTGGTGLLGSHLAKELREAGHEVVALHRAAADTLVLEELECELVEGDVRDDASSLVPAMSGCTHVVHGAALVYAGGAWPKVRSVNVDGTRNVLTAAVEVGVSHTVHISSVAVYGAAPGPVDEDTATDTDLLPGDLYARSKREAEEVARGIEEKRGLPVSIVRPSAVYGEHDRLMAPALKTFLRLPIVLLYGPADNTVPVVYAGNVATGIQLVLEAAKGGTTYDIGLDHPLTQKELLQQMAEGMGKNPKFVHVPAPVVRGAAHTLESIGVKTPGAAHLSLTRVAQLALEDNPYPSRRIREDLGWDPPHRHEDALRRTGRWVLDQA